MITMQQLASALRERLADLRVTRDATMESRAPVELDQASVGRLSRMDALQVQAMALAAQRRRQDEIRRIEAALQRIESDDYGYCVRCGDDIAPQRLAADPTVTTCIGCASGQA